MVQAKKRVKKAKKAAATSWLSRKASVEEMKQEYVAHVTVFEFFKELDATACGLLTQTRNHKFIGAINIMDIKSILDSPVLEGIGENKELPITL